MTKGIEAVRDHIRQSFLEVHNDRRSREERLADQTQHSAIEQSPVVKNDSTEKRVSAYISAALRSDHIRKQVPSANTAS